MLAALSLCVLVLVLRPPEPPEGLVVFTDLEALRLNQKRFELDETADVAVRATGSVVSPERANELAAWAWILRQDDHTVVWRMDVESVDRPSGTLAVVPGDTVVLTAGIYDVWYSTLGDRGPWRNDARSWEFVLDVIDKSLSARLLDGAEADEAADTGLVWRAAPLENDARRDFLFEVTEPTALDIYAIGEINTGMPADREDWSRIEDVTSQTEVWSLAAENSVPAGGIRSNRLFDGWVEVPVGVYRAVASTDGHHAFNGWRGSPPWDPAAWGITIACQDKEACRPFDPWKTLEPLISFTDVGDDEDLYRRFEVTKQLPIVMYALGEITRTGEYDYAELLEDGPNRRRRIWKMSLASSVHAGGDRKNRHELVIRTLEPGTYTLRYISDGSHSAYAWNASEPDYPERWGVTLFALHPQDTGGFRLLDDGPAGRFIGDTIVEWTRLDGDVLERHEFSLEKPAVLHIVSAGEMTSSRRYDYGYVLRVDGGETVWNMTYENTEPAGGLDRYRRFDGFVELERGDYMVYFVTDNSSHYGDFGDDGPDRPEEWGITISYAQ